jgi:hypothetical protein
MDWLYDPWHFVTALGIPAPPKITRAERRPNGRLEAWGPARPSPVDMCLVHLTYEVLATETSCSNIGGSIWPSHRSHRSSHK